MLTKLEKWFKENPPESPGYQKVVRYGILVLGLTIFIPFTYLCVWVFLHTPK